MINQHSNEVRNYKFFKGSHMNVTNLKKVLLKVCLAGASSLTNLYKLIKRDNKMHIIRQINTKKKIKRKDKIITFKVCIGTP